MSIKMNKQTTPPYARSVAHREQEVSGLDVSVRHPVSVEVAETYFLFQSQLKILS